MTSTPPQLVVPSTLAALGREERRARRRRTALGTCLVVLMVLPPAVWLVLARGTSPSDGTLTYPTDWSSQGVKLLAPRVDAKTCGEAFQNEDRVTTVNGRSLEDWFAGEVGEVPEGEADYGFTRGKEDCVLPVTIGSYPWLTQITTYFLVLPLVLVMWAMGAFVFMRRPRDPAARALFAMAVLLPYGGTAWPIGTQVIDLLNGPRLWPFVVGDTANALLWGAVLHFALVFPRPVPWLRADRRRTVIVYATPFLLYAGYVIGNALLNLGRSEVSNLDRLSYLVAVSIGAARVIPFVLVPVIAWQYVHAVDEAERRRVRWIVYSFLVSATLYLGLGQIPDLFGESLVPYEWLPIVFLGVPLALGLAVLRYGIFDLQILLRRSLVYGVLTTLLIVIPGALGFAVLTLLGDHPSRLDDPSTVNVILGTALIVAVFFQTLRGRVKRRVSRMIFGERDDPYEVVGQLGGHQSTVPAESLLSTIAETVAHALRLPYVAVELVGTDGVTDSESYGVPQAEVQAVSLTSHGEEIGRLLLGSGTRSEPFGPADQKLLELLAQQVGSAADNVLLTSRLQRSLERAVSTREEERRRLRRDIHDGLGPMLAASRMRLEVAHQLLGTDPDAAASLLSELVVQQQMVIDDVRRLVDDLRPPVLDELGLVEAIRVRADAFSVGVRGEGIKVTVDASPHLEPLPAAVEVAAYRIVLEALTNVARHAHARNCQVRIDREKAVVIEVADDGRGFPPVYRAGVGLGSMRERASEVGGECTVGPAAGSGTVVRARLPVPRS